MFDFLKGRKKNTSSFSPRLEIQKLVELSPPSSLVGLLQDHDRGEIEEIGKAFFLRRDKKLYSENGALYLTTPDNLKIAKDQNLANRSVILQFMNRRIPYQIECKILGRFRLLPEVAETLDFNAKAAYKLSPTANLKKQDKRQFYRYAIKNYGDGRNPITTHITFDTFIRATDQEFPAEGAPPVILQDVKLINPEIEINERQFTTRDAINEFRAIMLQKQPHERSVFVSKVEKDESTTLVKQPDEELLLGQINILGLEMESLRDVLFMKKSEKAGAKKGQVNPYNLQPGEKVITNFVHDKKYYQMLVEIMEARTQNEVVRPIDFPAEEEGLKVELADYSVGGVLVEGSPNLLRFLLGDECPEDIEETLDFEGDEWEEAFALLRKNIIHLTFFPKMHFPDAVKRFKPDLPFKICQLAQIVRTHVLQNGDRSTLHLGLQFCYEPQGIPLNRDDSVNWRYSRYIRDNEHFKLAHSQLSQLYGYLENQSLAASSSGNPNRQRRKAEKP